MGVWRAFGNQSDKTGREGIIEGMGRNVCVLNPNLTVGWVGDDILAKQHDGCEIQLLEGEETHTLPLGRTPF